MLRYNKKIKVSQQRTGQWRITTDRGDDYELMPLSSSSTPITDWWNMQHQSSLRHWQKDVVLQELTRRCYTEDFQLFIVYKPRQGHSQPHDIVIFYHSRYKLWILNTSDCIWFVPSDFTDCEFTAEYGLPVDITNLQQRKELYKIMDELNAEST